MFAYSVICQFSGQSPRETAAEWLAWLRHHHLADVIAAGAQTAEVVTWDGEPLTLEVRYRFSSREAFADYERDHAPRLRAEGLRLFPPEQLGLVFRRQTGEIKHA